jgi:hypothetical protein
VLESKTETGGPRVMFCLDKCNGSCLVKLFSWDESILNLVATVLWGTEGDDSGA